MKKHYFVYSLFFLLIWDVSQVTAFDAALTRGQLMSLLKEKKENACQNSASFMKRILKRGILRVAMHKKDHPPFFMISKKGELIGLDVTLANQIAEQLGVKVEFDRSENTFNGVVKRVQDNKSDIGISKISLTLVRARNVLYSEPYVSMTKSILINRIKLLQAGPGLSVKDVFSKEKAIIGALSGSSYEAFAERVFPKAQVYGSNNWKGDIIPRLIKGEIWAAFRDEIEVRRAMFLTKDASLHLLVVNLKDERDPMMMVINKEARHFREWINLFLKYAYKGETLAGTIERYKEYVYK